MNPAVYMPGWNVGIVDICVILFHSRVVHGTMLDAGVHMLFMAAIFTVIPMGEICQARLRVE